MSDQSMGEGWWLASDGKWYPPNMTPASLAPPPPPADQAESPWWRQRRLMIGAPMLAALIVLAAIAVDRGADEGDQVSAAEPAASPVEESTVIPSPEPEPTPTPEPTPRPEPTATPEPSPTPLPWPESDSGIVERFCEDYRCEDSDSFAVDHASRQVLFESVRPRLADTWVPRDQQVTVMDLAFVADDISSLGPWDSTAEPYTLQLTTRFRRAQLQVVATCTLGADLLQSCTVDDDDLVAAVSAAQVRVGGGLHEVGVEVPAGAYEVERDLKEDGCYWARLSIDTGDIIDNHFGLATGSLFANEGEVLEVTNCALLGPPHGDSWAVRAIEEGSGD